MPGKADKKRRRREAAAREMSRRYRQAEEDCPLSRSQLDDLHDHLATEIIENGYDGTFSITQCWLLDRHLPIDETIRFFESHRIHDDFELALHGDPHKLFGPTQDRFARMPLKQEELEELLDWVDVEVRNRGCDRTTRFTRLWLEENEHPVAQTLMALHAQGGHCDCEVVLNVDPALIYPNVP